MKKHTSGFLCACREASFFSQQQAYKRFLMKMGALTIFQDLAAVRAKNVDSDNEHGSNLFPKKRGTSFILHKALQGSLKVQSCVSAKFKNRTLAATAAGKGLAQTIDVSYQLK